MPLQRRLDNRYEVRESLGRGGMAEVYLAHDRVLDREVALKVLSRCYAEDEEFVRRFRREARSAASLAHPNVVSVHDLGEVEGSSGEPSTYYIAMEYVSGVSLRGLLEREGRLSRTDAVAIARQVAEGLGAAHARGIVHRDVKPCNILLSGSEAEGAPGWVKVADFGIARAAASEAVTGTGDVLGTAHYLSPEHVMGGEATSQSDLYALGVVLYEMLTGRRPYDADHPFGVAMQHVTGDLVPPKRLLPELPDELNSTVVRLLGKDPEERHRDAEELISDLDALQRSPQPAEAAVAENDPAIGHGGRRLRTGLLVPLCALVMLTATLWAVQQGFGLSGLTGEVRHGVESILRGQDEGGDPVGEDPGAGDVGPDAGPTGSGSGDSGSDESGASPSLPGETTSEDSGEALEEESRTHGSPEGDAPDEPADDEATREDWPDDPEEATTDGGSDDEGGEAARDGASGRSANGAGGSRSEDPDQAVYVPDLAGQSVEAARETLESTGFRVSGVIEEPGESPAGIVLRTDPPPGSALEPGSGVAIVASSGPPSVQTPGGGSGSSDGGDPGNSGSGGDGGPVGPPDDEEAVTVPDVSDRQSGQAVSILESAGLRAEVRGAFGEVESGTVVSSDPPAGSRVEEGALVTLTVIDESSPSITAEPGGAGEDQYLDQYEEE